MSGTGRVAFIETGPGAADLVTLRGARRIAQADLVLWPAGAVAPECAREHAGPAAELIETSSWGHEQALAVYRRAAAQRLTVAVLHAGGGGGPTRQADACRRLGMQVEIVPGVSQFAAAAAAAGTDLATAPLIVSHAGCGQFRPPAEPGCTSATVGSAARTGELVAQLRAAGYPDHTPVVVGSKVSLPDQVVLRTTLGELECTVKSHRLWRQAVFLVGHAMAGRLPAATGENGRTRSYHAGRARGFRRAADGDARRVARGGRRTS